MNWDAVNHGIPSLIFAYVVTGVPMLIGLLRQRAALHRILTAPLIAVLVTFAAVMAWGVIGYFLANAGAAPTSIVYWTGAIFLALFGYVAGTFMGRSHATTAHHRGTVIEEGRATHRAHADSLSLAGVPVPPLDETKHFKLIGTTGTGKSTTIRELLEGALARGDRAVIADPDGGYLDRFYNARAGDVILNPFDSRASHWDIFAEIEKPYDVEQLARALIPDQDGADKAWRHYARTFLTAVMRQLWELGATDSTHRSVGELYRLVSVASAEELRILVSNTSAQPFLESGNERMFGSIRSVASASLAPLEHIAQQRAVPLAVRQWTRGGRGRALFLPYTAGQISALRTMISAWMRLAIFEAMNGGERDQRLWFIVDELDALGQIDGLKDALARLRKFGGRCVLGFQSIAQVSSTYGQGEAQTIVENCGNTLILRCSASEGGGTARFASRLIGEREIVRIHESRSTRPGTWQASKTHSEQHVTESAVLPSEIEQLPDLAGYLKLASSASWRRVQIGRP